MVVTGGNEQARRRVPNVHGAFSDAFGAGAIAFAVLLTSSGHSEMQQ
jgi:hypothetical protein